MKASIGRILLINFIVFGVAGCLVDTEQPAKTNEPHWADTAIWYALFPERFANGDSANDPAAGIVLDGQSIPNWAVTSWTQSWWEPDPWMRLPEKSFRDETAFRRYGGDLQGVLDKLDYLKALGITAIWFNPIFDAQSLHKYDASSYHHIDRFFGPNPDFDLQTMQSENPSDPSTWKWTSADSLFLKVIEEAHKRNMKIILDGVFNHTGRHFWAFKDILEKGSRSSFANWYNIQEYDDPATAEDEMRYVGWWGIRALPSFRQTENDIVAPVKAHIFEITKRWMDPNQDGDPSDGIDGWRLDVAEELPTGFWQDWNAWVRNINPDAYTVAESWSDEAYDFMREADFDAVMNYRFAFLANEFWVNRSGSAHQYLSQLDTLFAELGHTYLFKTQNLLGSHDTARFLSMLANEGRGYDRMGQPEEGFMIGKPDSLVYERFKLAVFHQMTLPGSPLIYNGDELGMWGADDPHNRKPMWWPKLRFHQEKHGGRMDVVEANSEILRFYTETIELRQTYSALKRGDFIPFAVGKVSILAYERKDEMQHLLVMINTDSVAHSIPLDGNWRVAYKHNQVQLSSDSLNLGATSATLLLSL